MNKVIVTRLDALEEKTPVYALVANVDLVLIRYPDTNSNADQVSVLYGRCLHRGALLADGHIDGDDLICGVHNWDYRFDTGVSAYNPSERLQKFTSWIEDGNVLVDEDEISAWAIDNPQPYDRDAYQGLYADLHGGDEEPHY